MKNNWTVSELASHFTLNREDYELLENKRGVTRLGFAIALKFFQVEGRFPESADDVPLAVIHHIARQVAVAPEEFADYFVGRDHDAAAKKHRSQIRSHFGFRTPTLADIRRLVIWMSEQILPKEPRSRRLGAIAAEHLREKHIEPPTSKQMDRLLGTATHRFETRLFKRTLQQLSQETRELMDWLLFTGAGAENRQNDLVEIEEPVATRSLFHDLKQDPGGANITSVEAEIVKLQWIRELCLPSGLFEGMAPKVLRQYRWRAATEPARELRRHPQPIRYTLVAAFCRQRGQEITDNLVELLIRITDRMSSRAEQRLAKELLSDFRRVKGKSQILYRLASAAIAYPNGVVKKVIYPVVGEKTLRDLVREYEATGRVYQEKVQRRMRSSYGNHYRRMLPLLLEALEFRSTNGAHCPVLQALALVKRYLDSGQAFYPTTEKIPLNGVVSEEWLGMVMDPDSTTDSPRINRINYELAVLQTLRDKLGCKEMWVVGAHRYRDPDEDLPADFDEKRKAYYDILNRPLSADAFIQELQTNLRNALVALNDELPRNPAVRVTRRAGRGWIRLSPLKPQAEPTNLSDLKSEIEQRWSLTSLLDIAKETDLRVGFTEELRSAALRENLPPLLLQKRKLLCLHALGTNTGIKGVVAGDHGETYKDLMYVRRRFMNVEGLRNANARLSSAIFEVRQPGLWGEGNTACASDSKKFSAWDQNLLTEWHVRYGGRGVMVYWHVGRNSNSCKKLR